MQRLFAILGATILVVGLVEFHYWFRPEVLPLEVAKLWSDEPVEEWGSYVEDYGLHQFAPRGQLVTDFETWGELWQAWRGKEKIPPVNFEEDFVLVCTVGGPNLLRCDFSVQHGDLLVGQSYTLMGGSGFTYKMFRFNRALIKTYSGRPIPS